MKIFTFAISLIYIISILSCTSGKTDSTREYIETIPNIASDSLKVSIEPEVSENNRVIGDSIYGDFNSDGVSEYAFIQLIKEGEGNPTEDGIPAEFIVKFSDEKIPSIDIGCCGAILINEGDLNNDNSTELSIFQAPINGCTYVWYTKTFSDDVWTDIVESYLFLTVSCGVIITNDELKKIVTLEDGDIYYREINVENENTFITINDESRIDFDQLKKIKVNRN